MNSYTSTPSAERLAFRLVNFLGGEELGSHLHTVIYAHTSNGFQEASFIQSVGMPEPIPLLDLYQSTRLKSGPEPDVASMIVSGRNSLIYAGPGQGKTTLLKHQLLDQAENSTYIPVLFTLRTHGTLDLLGDIVQTLEARRRLHRVPHTPEKLLLLVDGYDEIADDQRRLVCQLLGRFGRLNAGFFILTCRTGYMVTDLAAREYELAEFNESDAIAFVDAFARAMRISVKGTVLIRELRERKLVYILSHPLMLTLACVVKTRKNPGLPHNAIELMRQAIETLAYRWDEGKGVVRASRLGLYSVQLLDCVTRIAYDMNTLKAPTSTVTEIIGRYLVLIRRPDIMPGRVLDEVRAFYGLLFTTPDGSCQFVHKTVQDYLAARYRVEKGLFQPARVETWDLQAAYCACLSHEATKALSFALRYSRSTEAIRECLLNNALFDPETVASSVFEHFDRYRENHSLVRIGAPRGYNISSKSDFMGLADDVFLHAIMRKGHTMKNTTAKAVVLGLCLSEYVLRKLRPTAEDMNCLEEVFGEKEATLRVWRSGDEHRFTLSSAIKDGRLLRLD